LRYSPHVDGLRAAAIVAVVGCHTGLPGFSGGYVGVDVFFVISGFLIITQIVAGLGDGSFRFGDFWSRRALRILPPLLVVLVATVAICSVVDVTLDQFVVLGQEALASALMAVNFFLLKRQGYFDDFLSTRPFLHLWSLAVEEQFYLLAPLVLAAGAWLYQRQRALCWGLAAAGFCLSLAAYITFSRVQAPVAFFMMPTRAWEFIAGGCVALLVPPVRHWRIFSSGILGVVGAVLIVSCTVLLQADASYPSFLAVAPVIGSTLLIVEGLAHPRRSLRPSAQYPPVRLDRACFLFLVSVALAASCLRAAVPVRFAWSRRGNRPRLACPGVGRRDVFDGGASHRPVETQTSGTAWMATSVHGSCGFRADRSRTAWRDRAACFHRSPQRFRSGQTKRRSLPA
jgi:peptidoglycan/LPS O-acetylase OafA/YrhL